MYHIYSPHVGKNSPPAPYTLAEWSECELAAMQLESWCLCQHTASHCQEVPAFRLDSAMFSGIVDEGVTLSRYSSYTPLSQVQLRVFRFLHPYSLSFLERTVLR